MPGNTQGGRQGGGDWNRGGNARPDRGSPNYGGQNRGGNDAERNERMVGMLRSMDANRNGILEPNEIPEQRRGMVSMIVTRMGGNPNGNINLNALARQNSRQGSQQSSRPNYQQGYQATSSQSRRNNNTTTMGNIATDPLVPYFGEPDSATAPILAFGLREPAPPNALPMQNTAPVLSQSDQILRTAREIMNRYDKNKNGTLDKDKGEWVSTLPFKPEAADTNYDGRTSMTELIAALGGKSGVSTGAAAVSTRQSTAYERIPAGMPPWFFERDKEQDGQLTMLEYANGQPWSENIVGEFEFLDRNRDGVATATEIFASLEEFDTKKKLQEDQAQREIARRSGTRVEPQANAEEGKQVVVTNGVRIDGKANPEGGTPPESAKVDGPPAPPLPAVQPQPGSLPTTGPYASGSNNSERRYERRDGDWRYSGRDGGRSNSRGNSWQRGDRR